MKLLAEPFSVENNMMTPTFKLKRNEAKIAFADEITRLYGEPVMKPTKK